LEPLVLGEVERGVISADMTSPRDAWLTVQLGESIQRIALTSRVRHFGGRQWFFVCPATGRRATVLWKPPGAQRFCSRQTWGRQVAYQSQFQDATNRAHLGKSRIKNRLIGELDPDEWDLPPSQSGCGGIPIVATSRDSITTRPF
jgi:hypothetical protein